MQNGGETIKTYLGVLGLALVGALVVRFFILEAYRVPTRAMHPSLESGDFILVAKWPYGYRLPRFVRRPERGEVVLFSHPDDPERESVKRVIALPGERVEVRGGRIRVNGVPWADERSAVAQDCFVEKPAAEAGQLAYSVCTESPELENIGPLTVPEGQVLLISDLRARSPSARKAPTWALVRFDALRGKVLGIWFSVDPSRQGWFPKPRFERMFRGV